MAALCVRVCVCVCVAGPPTHVDFHMSNFYCLAGRKDVFSFHPYSPDTACWGDTTEASKLTISHDYAIK